MLKFKKYAVFFIIGGLGYAIIELLWRGRTHWSMMLAGGICFILFSVIAEKLRGQRLLYKAILCALAVTAVEFIFGIVFNIILRMQVWDYSGVPFNFLGQICLLYTVIWGILGLVFVPLADFLNKKMQKI
ncbi:MAG: hypothetical protein IJN93_02410 [Clostridia bacterium]|nr:hypothetical protein [Clostridia bacterium]